MKWKIIPFLLALGFGLVGIVIVRAYPGELDATFGSGGKVITSVDSYNDLDLEAFVVQPDRKILTFSRSGVDVFLIRYLEDGTLDPAFGDNGVAITPSMYYSFNFYDIALQTDGKILAVGGGSTETSNVRGLLVRFLSDGSLDTDFGTDGIVVFKFIGFGTYDRGYAIEVQPDGKIVVAGSSWAAINFRFGLARFNIDGSFDTTFSGDGITTIDMGSDHDEAYDLAIQPDGKIIAAGYALSGGNVQFALLRLLPNGNIDNSFSGDGKVYTEITTGTDEIHKIFLLPSGKIVATGQANYFSGPTFFDLAIARYNTDGSLDTNFGSNGFTTTDINSEDNRILSAVQEWGGKTIVAFETNDDFAAIRYNSEGTLDSNFGNSGVLTTDFDVLDYIQDSSIQSDGKFILGGNIYYDTTPPYDITIGLARYKTSTTATENVCSAPVVLGNTDLQVRFDTPTCCNVTAQKIITYPGGAPGDPGELPIYWELTNDCTEPYSMTLDFYYTDGELENGVNVVEDNLVVFRNEGDALWTSMGGTVDTDANSVSLSNVTSLSFWTLGDITNFGNVGPTAVQLSEFTAKSNHYDSLPLLLTGFVLGILLLVLVRLRQTQA